MLKEKIRRINFICFIVLVLFILAACQNKKEGNLDSVANKIDSSIIIWSPIKDYTYQRKNQFKKAFKKAKEKLDNKIDELQRIAGNTIGNASMKYNKSVAYLKEERELLNKRMNDFGNVTQNNWNNFKSGINSVWDEIGNTLKDMNKD